MVTRLGLKVDYGLRFRFRTIFFVRGEGFGVGQYIRGFGANFIGDDKCNYKVGLIGYLFVRRAFTMRLFGRTLNYLALTRTKGLGVFSTFRVD